MALPADRRSGVEQSVLKSGSRLALRQIVVRDCSSVILSSHVGSLHETFVDHFMSVVRRLLFIRSTQTSPYEMESKVLSDLKWKSNSFTTDFTLYLWDCLTVKITKSSAVVYTFRVCSLVDKENTVGRFIFWKVFRCYVNSQASRSNYHGCLHVLKCSFHSIPFYFICKHQIVINR